MKLASSLVLVISGAVPLPVVIPGISRSDPDPKYHLRTLVNTQTVDGHVYLDAAGFAGRTVGLAAADHTQSQ